MEALMDIRMVRRNIRRLRYLLMGVVLIQSLFLVYVERVRLVDNAHELVWVSYLLHSVLAFYAMGTLVFLIFGKVDNKCHQTPIMRLPMMTAFMILVIAAVIALFDQITHGHITLFTIYMLAFGLLLYLKPPYNYGVYGIPFLLFVIAVLVFQSDINLVTTHLIYGTVIFVGILFTSTNFYVNFVNDLKGKDVLLEKNAQLEILSTVDPLTSLYNRRHLERQVKYEASINKRYQHEASLLLIDIDHFKMINDNYGHQVGDLVLVDIAKILAASVRESDTVARFGGEEFMILASHTDLDGAMVLAHRLNKSIEKHVFTHHDVNVNVTVSIGVTRLDHENFDVSYKYVDDALYEAKESGRNKVVKKG